mgnify:FL=1
MDHTCYAYSSAKYVWPLYIEDPTRESTTEKKLGESGCSVFAGQENALLPYYGVSLSGDVKSYVEVVMSSDNVFVDFSVGVEFYPLSIEGGTVLHYLHDTSLGGDVVTGGLAEFVTAFNSTHAFMEAFDASGSRIGYEEKKFVVLVNAWDRFSLAYDASKPEFKLISDLEKEILKFNLLADKDTSIALPGRLRVGAPIGDSPYPGLHGGIVCLTMHDVSMGHGDVTKVLESECASLNLSGGVANGNPFSS